MYKMLLASGLLLASLNLFAQNNEGQNSSDTTNVIQESQSNVVEETIVGDTVPNQEQEEPVIYKPPVDQDQNDVIEDSSLDTDTQPAQEEPRIIYYQTVTDDDRNDRDDYDKREFEERYRRRNEIKTVAGSMNHSGGFGAISFKTTKLRSEPIVFVGARGGWIVNRTLAIGFEGYGAVPTAKFDDIIPERVVTLGGYGGMFLELILFSNQVVHVTFPVSGGSGWFGYYEDWENTTNTFSDDLIAEDVFWYVEPGVDLELNVSRNFRLAGGVSKRYTQDLDLPNTRGKDFSKLSYFLTLKIGRF